MCLSSWVIRPNTIEGIIDANSVGMNDQEKAQYWYEIAQTAFALLGKVDVEIYEIPFADWVAIAQAQYPSLQDIKMSDDCLYTVDEAGLHLILQRDWTNLVPYIPNISDCDKFDSRLYDHLHTYYGITGVKPIWGMAGSSYHGFNLGVLRRGDSWIARLVEPQTDEIFESQGPLGIYLPKETAMQEAILGDQD